jgi:GDPmannose 4,6-dehydratase
MLQRDQPEDYVIATAIAHSVRDCLEIAFDLASLKIDEHVAIDESLRRPAEVDHLIGDASKVRRDLGWAPETSFEQMIRVMVDADHRLLPHG